MSTNRYTYPPEALEGALTYQEAWQRLSAMAQERVLGIWSGEIPVTLNKETVVPDMKSAIKALAIDHTTTAVVDPKQWNVATPNFPQPIQSITIMNSVVPDTTNSPQAMADRMRAAKLQMENEMLRAQLADMEENATKLAEIVDRRMREKQPSPPATTTLLDLAKAALDVRSLKGMDFNDTLEAIAKSVSKDLADKLADFLKANAKQIAASQQQAGFGDPDVTQSPPAPPVAGKAPLPSRALRHDTMRIGVFLP